MAMNLRKPGANYTFRFVGKQGKFYAFRAPTWNTVNRNGLDCQQFESEVAGWLMENADGEWHVGNAKNVRGYYAMPHAFSTYNSLCVVLDSETDMVAFEQAFDVIQTLEVVE